VIPESVCAHFTLIGTGCEIARFAPRDCHGCGAYQDGAAFVGLTDVDRERMARWLDFPRIPVAHFRGQP
jgi:hypothetical protein